MRFNGAFGRATCPAEPVAPDRTRFWSREFGNGMLATLARGADGTIDAVVISTSRTRGMRFDRMSDSRG